ncbi:MAG: Holliday junction branch migration protein RuvA [Phycisphaerae bacterium]|nr:Holliday junction branch migration protein RuvA [Phycisphaerae bacterium]
MIVRITGMIDEVTEESVVIERDGLAHEVLVPGYAIAELAAVHGQQVTLYTYEVYEGTAVGGNLVPRLIGFPHQEDRAFFKKFITVKGVGLRRALKALADPPARVASAIENGDTKTLIRLPGIGKRAAEQIVAELRGKLDAFAIAAAADRPPAKIDWTSTQRDALEILIAWGERRQDAEEWLQRAAQLHPGIGQAEDLIRAAYKIKAGTEG